MLASDLQRQRGLSIGSLTFWRTAKACGLLLASHTVRNEHILKLHPTVDHEVNEAAHKYQIINRQTMLEPKCL